MALDGQTTSQIRDWLFESKITTPRKYFELKRGKDIAPFYNWQTRAIYNILKNEQYTGSYVSGKQEQKAIGSHSKINIDKAEWIVIPDKHTPIVSKEDFASVQEILARYWKSRKAKPIDNPLETEELGYRRSRMVSGERPLRPARVKSQAPYGYIKTADGGLEIDELAAKVIREIFSLAADGVTNAEIAAKLTADKIPKPSERIKQTKGKDVTPTCLWSSSAVNCIISNEQYTGAYVAGKYLKSAETGKKYITAKSDRIVIPGKYPAIISKDLFDEVQAAVAQLRFKRKNMTKREYLFRGGIIKCGCCGYAMSYDKLLEPVYRCTHTYVEKDAECHKLKVAAAKLDETILTIIRKQAEVILGSDNLSELRKVGASGKRIADFEKEVAKCVEERQSAYERFVSRELDRESYLALKAKCSERIEQLNNQIAVIKQAERDRQSGEKTAALAKEIIGDKFTPRELVETLIDRVLVFPENKIEIQWKIADFAIQQIM
jgi:hypothetical protein